MIKTQTGEEYKISFKKCVIATGSSPKKLDNLNIPQGKILTNENIFKLEKIPNKITFIGGGPISCELAFAFAKLGSKVKIISTNAILPRENKELTKPIRNNFQKYNVEIIENANTKLELLKDDADYYVLAVGREPNTNLDLEKAKIKYSNLGIEIDNNLQTSNANVYALGDCTTSPKFTHLANNQGRFLIKKFLLPFTSKPNAALPAVTFTDPPIAQVGEIQESELVKKFAIDFNKSDRGMIDDTTENFGNIYVNMLTGKIVGANVVGAFSEHVINFFTIAINEKISVFKFEKFMAPYPTYFSAINNLYTEFIQAYFKQLPKNLKTFFLNNIQKFITGFFWLTTGILILIYLNDINWDKQILVNSLTNLFQSMYGMPLFVLAYVLRGMISLPATILTILGAAIFGFKTGTILTIVASNLSSAFAYYLGKTVFGSKKTTQSSNSIISFIKKNPFEAILTLRLTFFPYDLASYIAGALKINFPKFILATALGSLPGTLAISSIGASIDISKAENFENITIDKNYLLAGIIIFILSIIISRLVKKFVKYS